MEKSLRFRTKWYNSIAFKVSISIIFLILSLILILSFLFFRNTETESEVELRESGIYIAKTLSQQAVELFLYEDRYALYQLLQAFKKEEEGSLTVESIVEYAAVFDHEDRLLAFVGRDEGPMNFEGTEDPDLFGKDAVILLKNNKIFEVIAPILVNKVPVGKVRVGITRVHHFEQVKRFRKQLFIVGTFLAIVGTLLSLFMARRYILPILQVIRGAKKIGEGNWGTQITVKSRDETGEMAETFNEMSMKLKEAFDRVQRTQERWIQSEKLNAIGKFSANMAHELKNPLTSIKLCIQAMNEPGASGTLDLQEREMVLNDIQRMDGIVNRFLSYGAQPKSNLAPVDINSFLKGVAEKLIPRMEMSGVRLKLLLDNDLPTVFVDTHKMEEAVENLCMNAVQAMPQGGEICIRTFLNGSGEMVQVDVEDDGVGMDEKIREHLFEPFFTTRKDGSGLGLSIVYQIIKEHGGEIMVESEKEKGTRFSISLPV